MQIKEIENKVQELKGMVKIFMQYAKYHDQYNYPLAQGVEKQVNELANMFRQSVPSGKFGYAAAPISSSKSTGFHTRV